MGEIIALGEGEEKAGRGRSFSCQKASNLFQIFILDDSIGFIKCSS